MRMTDANDLPEMLLRGAAGSRFDRRGFLRLAGTIGASVGTASILAACSRASDSSAAAASTGSASASAGPDMAKARKEGLVLWHANDETAKTTFLKGFTAATGIPATSQRVLPGAALPKLQAEFQTGKAPSCDVYDTSEVGLVYTLQQQGHLMQYMSPELEAYESPYVSSPKGFWTTYFVSPLPITYRTDHLPEAQAPKSYEDLLDPKWKGKMGFQDSSGGSSFTFWYELRKLLPADYFQKLAALTPRSYSSSTQISTDLNSGVILLSPGFSMYQVYLALKQKLPYKIVLSAPGMPTNNLPTAIIANPPHPDAAKAYIDYSLSQVGQQSWTDILGSYSARSDVKPPAGLPSLASVNPLATASADPATAGTAVINSQFTSVWNNMLGAA